MVEDGIGIGFTESCDSFVFREHGSELCTQTLAALSNGSKGRYRTVLIVVKHRHFGFASPTPEHFHRRFDFTRVPVSQKPTVETSLSLIEAF
jgi:hypothetical protein